jgi:GT2 family glycosyltransferase
VASSVTVILVAHDEAVLAQRALEAIQKQTITPEQILVVDSSKVPLELSHPTVKVAVKSRLGEIVKAGVSNLPATNEHWLWIVHDDSEPHPNALAELLKATENSEHIAQVGPMQLGFDNNRKISQLGLTLSRFGELISPIGGQLDQSQHDQVTDVLAVSTSGMLVRSDVYEAVGGLDNRAPALAEDFDLSMRIRRHGFRVVVAPRAKVVHAGLSLSGKRKGGWLRGSAKTANRRAVINLHLVHDALPLALLYWLALPLLTVYRVFWRLAQKRPGYLGAELRAGFWGIFTLPKRLASRANSGKSPTSSLKPLRASWQVVSAHKRSDLEAEESANSLAAFERGDHETVAQERVKNFNQAAGWIFVTLFLALSWKLFPLAQAVQGGSALPLAQDWFSVFARAGASFQPIGTGFFGPSDPFNWVLLALGSLTFWSPSLSLVILLWLAKALAFVTAWKALSLITPKAWQRNLGAAGYALLPAFGDAVASGEYPAVVSTIVIPWLVYAVARAAGLGRSGSARSDSRTWSWVGLAGLLLAILGASTPVLAILALVGLALVAFTKIRRFGYLFWIPLPLAVIYLPLFSYVVFTLGSPLALLAEPTLGVSVNPSALAAVVSISNWMHWPLAIFLLLAIAALLVKRWVVSLSLAAFGILTFAVLIFTQSLSFPADLLSARAGQLSVSSSGHALAALIGLVIIALAVHFLASLNRKLVLALTASLATLSLIPLGVEAFVASPKVVGVDGAVVPLLLQKQYEQGTQLRLLVINQNQDELRAEITELSGSHLEDSNIAYRFSGVITQASEENQKLAQVVGDLASGNGAADGKTLKASSIGYVLVPNSSENANLVSALESSTILEGAGLTPYGDLWRVLGTSAEDAPAINQNPWSITKIMQLMALLGFVLLAIPSRPRVKRAKDTTIFIDQSESELDV